MEQIRLTIVTELYMKEMGIRQFHEMIGGSSYASVRRHFLKLEESGWLRKVRTAAVEGRGRPEALYRSTEQPVIDTETWRAIPLSIRDAIMVQLLEEMGGRLGRALELGTADARPDAIAAFKILEADELAWRKGHAAVERCFQTLVQEQTDAKMRLETAVGVQSHLMVVNLAAFEAPGRAPDHSPLPRAAEMSPPPPWPQRVGKVFSDRLDLEIVYALNNASMSPAELQTRLGGTATSGQTFLRRCKRLADLGWAVSVGTETGGSLHGASVNRFRAAAPNVSGANIWGGIPEGLRTGRTWDVFRPFFETSIAAIRAGTFNARLDAHLTMSPLLVDETGWTQVAGALRALERDLKEVEDDLDRRRSRKGFEGFRAAFLLSGYETRSPTSGVAREGSQT